MAKCVTITTSCARCGEPVKYLWSTTEGIEMLENAAIIGEIFLCAECVPHWVELWKEHNDGSKGGA